MQLKSGSRLKSAVCDTQVIIVRAPGGDAAITCGGVAMIAVDADPPAGAQLQAGEDEGTLLGKRYATEDLELLCTKAGKGSLAVNGTRVPLKEAKPLPSSD